MYDCDSAVFFNVCINHMFVGEWYLTLVPAHLLHLRELCLENCRNMCDKYVDELVATVPQLKIIK